MKIQNSRRSDVLLLITYFVFYTLVLSLLLAFAAAHIPLFRNGAVYYVAYGAGTLLTFLIFFWQKKKVLREDFEKFRTHFGKNCRVVFLALLIIYLCNILINLLLQHFHISNQNQNVLGGLAAGGYLWLLILLAVVFAPVVEELVFRNIIFNRLYPKNHLLAYLVSMVTFSLLHGAAALTSGKLRDMLATLIYLPLAFFLCRLYETRKNIIFPIALHFVNNLLAVLLLLLLQAVKGA